MHGKYYLHVETLCSLIHLLYTFADWLGIFCAFAVHCRALYLYLLCRFCYCARTVLRTYGLVCTIIRSMMSVVLSCIVHNKPFV